MINGIKKIVQHTIDCKCPDGVGELQKQQEGFFYDCISRNSGIRLYKDCGIISGSEKSLSVIEIVKKFGLFDYARLRSYIDSVSLTKEKPLYIGRTSGTSDGNNGGKDIPVTRTSLENGEKRAMKNTLCSIVFDYGGRFLVKGRALVLSGGFDGKRGYISGIINYHSGYVGDYITYPPKEILAEQDRMKKKQCILADLRENDIKISSIHGVPTWPLELLQYIIEEDTELAKRVFAHIAYISIGGGPALDYKKRYKKVFESIGIVQDIAFTNNHNATEGFFGSQMRNFTDLEFHRMKPHIWGNWFGYIVLSDYNFLIEKYAITEPYFHDSIIGIHEVIPGIEYVQIVINDRIPVPYVIKDVVVFNDEGEYIVTGRIGMASNVANEHIEQKHILECIGSLHKQYPEYSDYFAIAGMEVTESHVLIFHRIIELKDVEAGHIKTLDPSQSHMIEDFIHNRFIEHHEQYAGFVKRGKIIGVKVRIVGSGQIIQYLKKLGRRHEQSKIPHIGNDNYSQIIAGWASDSI